MTLRPLAFFLVPAASVAVVAVACDDKSDDDDDDDDESGRGRGNCGGGGPWGGSSRDCDSGPWGHTGDWDWDSGDADNACSDGEDREVDSCEWYGFDMCMEFDDYASTEDWCNDIGATYGIETGYSRGSCPSGELVECDVTHVGGDFPSGTDRITTHYYDGYWNAREAEEACYSSGGNPL